jgi:hypothetical protein
MHTDFSKASAFENLVMYTEGNQTHVTNDVETVKKLLERIRLEGSAGEDGKGRRDL